MYEDIYSREKGKLLISMKIFKINKENMDKK